MLKAWVKRLLPPRVISRYHWILAVAANRWYGRPSEKLIVIGVTGTSGKSTVAEMVSAILEAAGFTVGVASTIRFKIGRQERLNDTKMTMLGRFRLQQLISEMVAAGCRYAVVETSSQGILQFRHIGIHYDTAVLTNLYPEHLDAHGGFGSYLAAKRDLFRHLERLPRKRLEGNSVPKTSVVNLDVPQAPEFLGYATDRKIGFSVRARYDISGVTEVRGEILRGGGRFGVRVEGQVLWLELPGEHNAVNALAAACVTRAHGVGWGAIARGLASLQALPGRIERVEAGQPYAVIVDYAFEPVAMGKLYEVARTLPHRRIIQVLGTTGGGRDQARGEMLGRMAGEFADLVVVTDEDPYDDDPRVLAERVVRGAQQAGKVLRSSLFLELDRRAAIRQALAAASPKDLVLVTGKGCEQAIVVAGGKKIPWDDRRVVREEIARLLGRD